MTATSKHFSDTFPHPPCTGSHTLAIICCACDDCHPNNYAAFLKIIRKLYLNRVIELFWEDWPLSCPSRFFYPESLYHFLRFSWDHDIKWCIEVVTPLEIDFHFSLLQPVAGYRGFEDGVSRLKQVTRCDHRSVQCYIIGVIAGAVPCQFLIVVRALIEFHYLAQSPIFSEQSLSKLMNALKLFHDNKDAVIQAGG